MLKILCKAFRNVDLKEKLGCHVCPCFHYVTAALLHDVNMKYLESVNMFIRRQFDRTAVFQARGGISLPSSTHYTLHGYSLNRLLLWYNAFWELYIDGFNVNWQFQMTNFAKRLSKCFYISPH